jgi:hypothetical protein
MGSANEIDKAKNDYFDAFFKEQLNGKFGNRPVVVQGHCRIHQQTHHKWSGTIYTKTAYLLYLTSSLLLINRIGEVTDETGLFFRSIRQDI